MRLMESLRLSPKQALHLISVGDQQFLIGATDQNVAVIAQVESGVETALVATSNAQPGLDFGSVLQSFNINLRGGPSK
jgi:flagellar biogenesis protein FliO